MNKKRLVALIALLLFVAIFTCSCSKSAREIPIPEVEQDVYVYDQNGIIDNQVERTLNSMLVELEKETGVEFVIVSVNSLLDRNIETYSNEVFNTLGIGKEDKDNGILLLFSRMDSRVRLEIGRGLEGCLNDSKCGRILDDYFVPYREEDKYTEATYNTVNAVLSILSEEYGIQIDGLETVIIEENDEGMGFWEILIIAIVTLVLFAIVAIVVGNDEGGFGSSGGFFGGGYSGGSYRRSGGFGGGFSGGGGASR